MEVEVFGGSIFAFSKAYKIMWWDTTPLLLTPWPTHPEAVVRLGSDGDDKLEPAILAFL
jgi:hypothetical protein